ncbi:GrpB family protein [Clostridium estertheticum]|uniref:GrpB family protein n=1 Tax=Clostridium estertheticum TaxID=238834 RepID=A0A7Y3T083_9CLOT|nr:GrpB family protein [Clostridium estertheticum]NNU78482.1 GrpB family protein [Clostridium estertheticum]WBL49416.1 GrpB family protein [Clostridium estertheticum]
MIGLKRGTVQLENHSIEWEENAKKTIEKLMDIFNGKAVDIQHIGSTAVKDLKAKPIIDIVVGVKSFYDVLEVIPVLKNNGFIHKSLNDNEKHMFFFSGDYEKDIRTHHIHANIYGDDEWNNYIKFRDTLNKNQGIRKEYEDLKLNLLKKFPDDRDKYTEMKANFIKKVLCM